MDAYSSYNQINIDLMYAPNMTFTYNNMNHYYNVMPFRLKNACVTYQRLMDVIISYQIGNILEVSINDMIVKTSEV